ncbi:E3 ubiquitin-protein ligase MARCH11-like protein [Cinnamomum micranthum f. kanehirae]|uniref:E3 ubiquitin-protein ligase MARCH11-like protein n=1 Tax=Cinnamomum micranthum f. kanehirae TaxID=337451 RepID=A0A443PAH3_9MAGN|nr:E3 ubiquitin-protein ligase MARCH11-like protein [Cinnamomum micranthum f. kanehirae]
MNWTGISSDWRRRPAGRCKQMTTFLQRSRECCASGFAGCWCWRRKRRARPMAMGMRCAGDGAWRLHERMEQTMTMESAVATVMARRLECDGARICHQQTEEALMDIGCRCRGELSKTHRSCIDFWFYSRGSNKCEICQQVATNIPAPHSNPSVNYWAGGVQPAVGRLRFIQGEHERGSFRTLWFAFLIVIGGLLLDVLISISLGVSALPLNVIIGILLLLGLGTLVRIALECCRGCISRTVDANINPGYHPSV